MFLGITSTKIVHLSECALREFSWNYSAYRKKEELRGVRWNKEELRVAIVLLEWPLSKTLLIASNVSQCL